MTNKETQTRNMEPATITTLRTHKDWTRHRA